MDHKFVWPIHSFSPRAAQATGTVKCSKKVASCAKYYVIAKRLWQQLQETAPCNTLISDFHFAACMCASHIILSDWELSNFHRLIGDWPNTYTYTKALAEDIVRRNSEGIPVGVFRPAIVTSSAKEPLVGWIDNLYGPTGVVAGAGTGVLRTMHCNKRINANIVPVDFCVNALIAAAWDVNNHYKVNNQQLLLEIQIEIPPNWWNFLENLQQ